MREMKWNCHQDDGNFHQSCQSSAAAELSFALCVFFSSIRIREHTRSGKLWKFWRNSECDENLDRIKHSAWWWKMCNRLSLASLFSPLRSGSHTVIVIVVIINCRTRTQCLECGEKLISIEAEASIDGVRLIRRVNEQQPTAANSKSCAVGASRQAFEYGKKIGFKRRQVAPSSVSLGRLAELDRCFWCARLLTKLWEIESFRTIFVCAWTL